MAAMHLAFTPFVEFASVKIYFICVGYCDKPKRNAVSELCVDSRPGAKVFLLGRRRARGGGASCHGLILDGVVEQKEA